MYMSNCNNDIPIKKKILRQEMLSKLKNFDGKKESLYIINQLKERTDYCSAPVILAFSPLSTEPDIAPLLKDSRIALPYIENGEMHFSSSRKMIKSPLGFLEPEHIMLDFDFAIMLVPLLAFDSNNYRLGRGGGFYDRFIHKNKDRIHTIGIAYSISKVDEIPRESFDERLDEIITCPYP